MNLLFTICGRAGSKGIRNKNLKDFLGYPLPFYTVSAIDLYKKQVQHQAFHCDIVLNTDSKALIQLFETRLSIKVDIIERDPTLGFDHTAKGAVIRNSWEEMQKRKAIRYDLVVDLDITSPLRTVEDVNQVIQKQLFSDADVTFSVTDARRNPYFNMVKQTENGYERVIASKYNTRQEAPELFDMNASIYAYSPVFLASGSSLFAGKCDVVKMLDTAVLDLDHENDFELMQVIATYMFDKYPEFRKVRDQIIHILV